MTNEDYVICEIGGTVGDIESLPFLEALRQLRNELGRHKTCFIHLTLVPYLNSANEFKTKPTQHSVKELLGLGIQPDILLCRAEKKFTKEQKNKISLFCNLQYESVIMVENVKTIYEVPIKLYNEGILKQIFRHFNLQKTNKVVLNLWKRFLKKLVNLNGEVSIGIVGKYTNLSESYKSLNEALFHSGIFNNTKVKISWIDSRKLKNLNDCSKVLKKFHGILVPGGFGKDGSDGKINAIKYSKNQKNHSWNMFWNAIGNY